MAVLFEVKLKDEWFKESIMAKNGMMVKNRTIRKGNRNAIKDIKKNTRNSIKTARQDMRDNLANTSDKQARKDLRNQFRQDRKSLVQDKRGQVQNIRSNPKQSYLDRMNAMKADVAANPPMGIGTNQATTPAPAASPTPAPAATPLAGRGGMGMNPMGGPAPKPAPVRPGMKKGGKVGMGMTKNNYKKGGSVSSCSKRADGCVVRGKTKGRMV